MKKGLGSFFIFHCFFLSPAFGETDVLSVIQKINSFREQETSEPEELALIQKIYDQMEDLKIEEARVLLTEISGEVSSLIRQIEIAQTEDEKVLLRNKGRDYLRLSMAIILRTPPWISQMEKWLDVNRKTYIILMEVFVVAAAILGAEIALKGDSSFLWKFSATFAISLSSAAVFVIPARYFRRMSYERRFNILARGLFPESLHRRQPLLQLAREFRYPSRLVKCREILVLTAKKSPA